MGSRVRRKWELFLGVRSASIVREDYGMVLIKLRSEASYGRSVALAVGVFASVTIVMSCILQYISTRLGANNEGRLGPFSITVLPGHAPPSFSDRHLSTSLGPRPFPINSSSTSLIFLSVCCANNHHQIQYHITTKTCSRTSQTKHCSRSGSTFETRPVPASDADRQ